MITIPNTFAAESARSKARRILSSANLGADVAEERKKRREMPTFGAWVDTYLSRVRLENKDPRSGGHVQRVASYSAQMCERLGMSNEDREIVVKGALLHDLGMIGIPEEILAKHSGLSADEELVLGGHASMGASILGPMTTFQEVIPIVKWHHERADGSGFPDGLRGDEIEILRREEKRDRRRRAGIPGPDGRLDLGGAPGGSPGVAGDLRAPHQGAPGSVERAG